MSCCARLFAFLVSMPTFAVGFKFVMACPKLIGFVYRDLLVVLVGQEVPWGTAWPNTADSIQANGICRLLLTWAAATHCPRFLNGAQICAAGVLLIPVSVWIF